MAWVGDRYLAVGKHTVTSTGLFFSGPPPESNEEKEEFENIDKLKEQANAEESETKKALVLQVGPNEGNHFYVDLTDARSEALRIDELNVETQESANKAITQIDTAIQIISDERVKFGVYNNALQHISNNVTNYELNLTAAESRIRDIDMAKEMMEQTKNSILSQVSQAMLAQANSLPQEVLQLLR